MDISQEMFTTFKDDPDLLKKVITGNESWVFGYDIETKAQSFQSKLPEKLRPNTSTTDDNIETKNEMILNNRRMRLLIMFVYRSAHVKQFLRMF